MGDQEFNFFGQLSMSQYIYKYTWIANIGFKWILCLQNDHKKGLRE